jgi:hypothetical protein
MAPILVIVADVATYEPDEVAVSKDDDMLEEFPPAAPDPALSPPRDSAKDCGTRCAWA